MKAKALSSNYYDASSREIAEAPGGVGSSVWASTGRKFTVPAGAEKVIGA
jgi:hypothetical protein